jgi:hypothetical protein
MKLLGIFSSIAVICILAPMSAKAGGFLSAQDPTPRIEKSGTTSNPLVYFESGPWSCEAALFFQFSPPDGSLVFVDTKIFSSSVKDLEIHSGLSPPSSLA